jgi:hypothetical protein
MLRLNSKIQYNNFEPGEFVDVQLRSYEEVVELIERFPWEVQRIKIVIGMTNPSITIEGKNNDFLQFALYYNQKFVLRYFDKTRTLFTKTFINLKDGYKYIRNYFDQSAFDITEFKKEVTWLQHNLKHFVTQDFRYVLTPTSVINYLLSTSGVSFCFSIIFLIVILLKGINSINPGVLILVLILMFSIGGGIHLIVFFNYYRYVKDKILIMSKGSDVFYFGNIDNPAAYDKKDILQYTIIRNRGSKNPFNGFAITEIEFKGGTVLKIPNLLVGYPAMEQKLFQYPGVDRNGFPFLR